MIEVQVQRVEDSKVVEEEEEKGLEEVADKLFVITMVKLDILCATVKTQCIHLVNISINIADSSIM